MVKIKYSLFPLCCCLPFAGFCNALQNGPMVLFYRNVISMVHSFCLINKVLIQNQNVCLFVSHPEKGRTHF